MLPGTGVLSPPLKLISVHEPRSCSRLVTRYGAQFAKHSTSPLSFGRHDAQHTIIVSCGVLIDLRFSSSSHVTFGLFAVPCVSIMKPVTNTLKCNVSVEILFNFLVNSIVSVQMHVFVVVGSQKIQLPCHKHNLIWNYAAKNRYTQTRIIFSILLCASSIMKSYFINPPR